MEQQNSDKRRYLRYEVLDYALVQVEGDSIAKRSVIVDIGLGGLQLRMRDELPLGTICILNVGNLEHQPVVIRGEVRHTAVVEGSDLFSIGVRFMPENHEQRSAVAEYVHSVFQRQADMLTF
jgi:c-di-GMP-binding flagellar brake protein YcgR